MTKLYFMMFDEHRGNEGVDGGPLRHIGASSLLKVAEAIHVCSLQAPALITH